MASSAKKETSNIPFWPGVLLTILGIPALFWLRFGYVDSVAYTFTGFLLLLMLGIQFIPTLNAEYGKEQNNKKVKPGKFDWLGVIWLLSIPFGPFLLWMISSLSVLRPDNWRFWLGLESGLCVVIPIIAVLPLLRYLRGKAGPYALLILVIGTCFPVTVGWNATMDFYCGPVTEAVEIISSPAVHQQYKFKDIGTDLLIVTLADGRQLEANKTVVSLKRGSANLTWLKNKKIILACDTQP